MLLSKIQGTQVLIYYIERSTTQLVKHKALNLVDMDSSPMMGVTSYDVIFIEVYIKSQLNIILLSRPLGATLVEVFMSIRQLQVPGCCKHDNPALGGYICGIFSFD